MGRLAAAPSPQNALIAPSVAKCLDQVYPGLLLWSRPGKRESAPARAAVPDFDPADRLCIGSSLGQSAPALGDKPNSSRRQACQGACRVLAQLPQIRSNPLTFKVVKRGTSAHSLDNARKKGHVGTCPKFAIESLHVTVNETVHDTGNAREHSTVPSTYSSPVKLKPKSQGYKGRTGQVAVLGLSAPHPSTTSRRETRTISPTPGRVRLPKPENQAQLLCHRCRWSATRHASLNGAARHDLVTGREVLR